MKSLELSLLLNRSLEKVSPIAGWHVRATENDGEPLVPPLGGHPTYWSKTEATRWVRRLDIRSENISSSSTGEQVIALQNRVACNALMHPPRDVRLRIAFLLNNSQAI